MFDLNWTASEKRIARRAFQTALDRELAALIEESKKRMNQVSTPEELWELEQWLSDRRKDIDETYDFRYSILPVVFAKASAQTYPLRGRACGPQLREDRTHSARIRRLSRMT